MLPRRSFYYVRHGETDWNRAGRMQGHSDIPLNARGREQAEQAAERVRGLDIASICSSPLARAADTAGAISAATRAPVVYIEDLKEVGFGVAEGEPSGAWYVEWRQGLSAPEGGETLDTFTARVIRGARTALEHPGPTLITAHGGVFRRLSLVLGCDAGRTIPNGVPFRLDPPATGTTPWTCTEI